MKTNSKVTACLATALILAFALPAQAATITVNSAADDLPPFTNDGNCTLREAITNANSGSTFADCAVGDAGLDEIVFDAALAGATITLDGTQLQPITEALSITGPVPGDPAGMILNGAGASRILAALGASLSDFPVTLDSMTLTGGRTTAANERGGAVQFSNVDLTLRHVVLSGNTTEGSSARGGALSVESGLLMVENSEISNNSTSGEDAPGGGVEVFQGRLVLRNSMVSNNATTNTAPPTAGAGNCGGGIVAIDSPSTVTDSILTGNRTVAENSFGGALCSFGRNLSMERCRVIGNATEGNSASGGGLAIIDADITILDSTITDNSTMGTEASGGGIYVAGDATIARSEISANSTHGDQATGGGLALDLDSSSGVHSLTLRKSTVANNSTNGAGAGSGGLSVLGNTLVINSTISGNAANGASSAVGGLGVALDTTLIHSSVIDNVSADGVGGIIAAASGGIFTLNNSLVVQSAATNLACNGIATGVNNRATDTSCGDEPNNADGSGVTVDTAVNINLAPLAFNGGLTRTHALNAGSVAIDAAPFDAVCHDPSPSGASSLDQRGVARPLPDSGLCDLGAFEAGAELDLGDAPDADPRDPATTPPRTYPTLLANNGAVHTNQFPSPTLGNLKDFESDGQPTDSADGDDLDNTADEDGVFFASTITPGSTAMVDVTAMTGGGAGILDAWMDFNADGAWSFDEQIFNSESLSDGSNPGLAFSVPADAVAGPSFARFRITDSGTSFPDGLAVGGEVEDYRVFIGPEPTVMFNDAVMNPTIRENVGSFTIPGAVLLSNPSSQEVMVDVIFDPSSAATLGADFDYMPTTVSFPPGETLADITVVVVDDGVAEGPEVLRFALQNPVNATLATPTNFTATLDDPAIRSNDDDDDDDSCSGVEYLIFCANSGCSLGNGKGRPDPLLPLLILLALAWVIRSVQQRKATS